MLGVNATTDSYRFKESRLAPNIGLDDGGVAHPEVGTIHTRLGGQPVQAGEDDI